MKITSVKPSTDGFYICVTAEKASYTLRRSYESEDHRKLAVIGGNYDAAKRIADRDIETGKLAAPGKLAKGLDVHNAPHSTKAMADSRGRTAVPAKAKAAPKPKTPKVRPNAAPKADDPRKIVHLRNDYVFGAEGTARRASWDACVKAKSVADYVSAGGKVKYLPRWVAAKVIKLEN